MLYSEGAVHAIRAADTVAGFVGMFVSRCLKPEAYGMFPVIRMNSFCPSPVTNRFFRLSCIDTPGRCAFIRYLIPAGCPDELHDINAQCFQAARLSFSLPFYILYSLQCCISAARPFY